MKAYTASHEGDITDKSHAFSGSDSLRSNLEFMKDNALGGPGYRWLVYTSRNKHGTFVSKASCEDSKWFCLADYCGADGVSASPPSPDPQRRRANAPARELVEPLRLSRRRRLDLEVLLRRLERR